MIISEKYKFIILSVPKTGSTAMQHMFKVALDDEVRCVYRNNTSGVKLRSILPQQELKAKVDNYDSYKKIAVVRNPWDYVVSWYAYTRRLPKEHPRSSVDKDFNEFVKTMKHVWFNYPEPSRRKTWNITQMSFISNNANKILVDAVIRFEDLRKDGISKTMNKLLNIDLGEDVIKNDSQRSEDYRDYYNQEAIEIVRKAMSIDITTFDYEY